MLDSETRSLKSHPGSWSVLTFFRTVSQFRFMEFPPCGLFDLLNALAGRPNEPRNVKRSFWIQKKGRNGHDTNWVQRHVCWITNHRRHSHIDDIYPYWPAVTGSGPYLQTAKMYPNDHDWMGTVPYDSKVNTRVQTDTWSNELKRAYFLVNWYRHTYRCNDSVFPDSMIHL